MVAGRGRRPRRPETVRQRPQVRFNYNHSLKRYTYGTFDPSWTDGRISKEELDGILQKLSVAKQGYASRIAEMSPFCFRFAGGFCFLITFMGLRIDLENYQILFTVIPFFICTVLCIIGARWHSNNAEAAYLGNKFWYDSISWVNNQYLSNAMAFTAQEPYLDPLCLELQYKCNPEYQNPQLNTPVAV